MKPAKEILKSLDELAVLKEHTLGWHIACDAIASVQGDMQEMLDIFQWMACDAEGSQTPGCHPQNMRAEAKRMLEKYK